MFRHVIVGVDGGATGRDAVAVAKLLVGPDTRLVLVHVHELTPVRGASGAYGVAENEEALRLLEAERTATGVNAELTAVTASSVGRGLHYVAEEQDADLLVVGSSARSFAGRVLVGDISRAALAGAPCAVAVAPLDYAHDHTSGIAKIGVGYDGSPESEAALAFARELAALHGASLAAMMVVEPPAYAHVVRSVARVPADHTEQEQAQAELDALEGVEGHVALGLAGEELAAFGSQVDLLVVGSRGYGPVRRLIFGSTSGHLAGNARCPLVVLPRLGEGDEEVATSGSGRAEAGA